MLIRFEVLGVLTPTPPSWLKKNFRDSFARSIIGNYLVLNFGWCTSYMAMPLQPLEAIDLFSSFSREKTSGFIVDAAGEVASLEWICLMKLAWVALNLTLWLILAKSQVFNRMAVWVWPIPSVVMLSRLVLPIEVRKSLSSYNFYISIVFLTFFSSFVYESKLPAAPYCFYGLGILTVALR